MKSPQLLELVVSLVLIREEGWVCFTRIGDPHALERFAARFQTAALEKWTLFSAIQLVV